MAWLLISSFAGAGWLVWQVARRADAVRIHSRLNHDLLILVSRAVMILPIDPSGARLILQEADRVSQAAKDELMEKGLWRSR